MLAAEGAYLLFTGLLTLTDVSIVVDGAGAAPAARRPNVQMPDEYLPPNKILFLQNLPDNVTKDQLMALFSQYVSSPYVLLGLNLMFCHFKISELVRSASYSDQEGYRIRGIHGRGIRNRRERRTSQLQARRREQNQSIYSYFCYHRFFADQFPYQITFARK